MRKMRIPTAIVVITVSVIVAAIAMTVRTQVAQARDDQHEHDSRIDRGLEIAPVTLNMQGKNRALVGLGSYWVNAVASCNDCHSAGPQTQFAAGANPYFGQRAQVNPATYLGGGRDFGPLVPGTPNIISRNLTPDKTGMPAGGLTFDEFHQVLRTGADLDHLHPSCSSGQTTDCLPAPFDGNVLQIMPWSVYQNLTEQDIRAIYEYLSAIPCIEGPPAPNVLHNDCQ